MEPGDLVKLSQAELSMRLGSDTGGGSWRKGKGKGKVKYWGFCHQMKNIIKLQALKLNPPLHSLLF